MQTELPNIMGCNDGADSGLEDMRPRAIHAAADRFLEPLRKLSKLYFEFVPNESQGNATPCGEHTLCRLMNGSKVASDQCRPAHLALRNRARIAGTTGRIVCPNGFTLFAVPITSGLQCLGFIEGGRVFTKMQDETAFLLLTRRLTRTGSVDLNSLRADFFAAPVVSTELVQAASELAQFASVGISLNSAGQLDMEWPPPIAKASRLARERFKEKLPLGFIAKMVGLNEDYFSKLFKRTTGIAFTDYVMRMRVTLAQQILASSVLRISETAFECGFESVPHFNRVFKRFSKMAPRDYRKRMRKNRVMQAV